VLLLLGQCSTAATALLSHSRQGCCEALSAAAAAAAVCVCRCGCSCPPVVPLVPQEGANLIGSTQPLPQTGVDKARWAAPCTERRETLGMGGVAEPGGGQVGPHPGGGRGGDPRGGGSEHQLAQGQTLLLLQQHFSTS
jgi:hypothetical protein